MKSFFCLVGLAAATPLEHDAYANVREVNQQLSDIRKSAALAPGDAVGRAIETWKKHESYMRDRDTPEAILAKFVAIGKDLNLKGLIQKAMPEEERKKTTIGALDSNKKWEDYGCYCLPSQAYTDDLHWLGRGTPVDEIDQLCQKLVHCYQCNEKTYANCPAIKPYSYRTDESGDTSCANGADSCKGALCRCDVDFSLELANLSSTWSKKYSTKFGFDRQGECNGNSIKTPSSSNPISNIRWVEGNTILDNSELNAPKCCGRGLDSTIYHPSRLECCQDGSTKAIGTCDF